jgi:hypothetical protein
MNSLENQREVTVMTRLRCYLGKHKWESRQDSWGETLDVRLLRQATHTHPPGKYAPPVPPGAD